MFGWAVTSSFCRPHGSLLLEKLAQLVQVRTNSISRRLLVDFSKPGFSSPYLALTRVDCQRMQKERQWASLRLCTFFNSSHSCSSIIIFSAPVSEPQSLLIGHSGSNFHTTMWPSSLLIGSLHFCSHVPQVRRPHSWQAHMWILYNGSYTIWSTIWYLCQDVRPLRFISTQRHFRGNLSSPPCHWGRWETRQGIWILRHSVFVTCRV